MKKIIFILIIILTISFINAKQYKSGFLPADQDTSGTFEYYGFQTTIDRSESWYIMKISTYNFEYTQGTGSSNYDIAWSSHTTISYTDPFDLY